MNYLYLLLAAVVLIMTFYFGFIVGKIIIGLKYSVKLDKYRIKLEYKDDRIEDLNKKLKREREKKYNAK